VKPPQPATPFDVRCLGLVFDLDTNVNYLEQCRSISEAKVVEITQEAKGICRILWEMDQPGTFVSAWFDQQQGYSPIRVEVRVGNLADLPSTPLQRAETTWTNISGVWVPGAFLSEFFTLNGELESKTELGFEWESVNERVPEKLFTAAGMGLPSETRLVSYELGRRVALGNVGGAEVTPLPSEQVMELSNRSQMIAVVVSVLLVAALLAAILVRRYRATRRL